MSALRPFIAALALMTLPTAAIGQGMGVTPDGQQGRIHVVVPGDTLWDITATYLGTPWIWPSIWKENSVDNPHLIFPGDLIWITEGEMRKLTPEEAAALMAGVAPAAAEEEDVSPVKVRETDPFAVLDTDEGAAQEQLVFHGLENAPFISAEMLEETGAILGNHDENYWLSQEQSIIVSLGEGTVHTGDNFSAFRVRRRVLHPETGLPVGYFIEIIGRVEVTEVHPESSLARVLISSSEIEPGDRILPYADKPTKFLATRDVPEIEGMILAQRPHRIYSGMGDVVILDRGAEHGLVSGNQLIIYRAGRLVHDPVSTARVLEPDDIVGRLFVLEARERTSIAMILDARTEVEAGDRFRNP